MGEEQGALQFDAGIITQTADYLRQQNALKVGNNINMLKRGVLTSRYNGWVRQNADLFNGGAACLGFGQFVDVVGTKTLIVQAGDAIISYDLATQNVIGSGFSSDAIPCMRMFSPYSGDNAYLVFCNGVDEPYVITGIGVGDIRPLQMNLANFPITLDANLGGKTYGKPKFCMPFLDRMIYAGFAGDDQSTYYDVMVTNSGSAETCVLNAPQLATDGGVFQVDANYGAITGVYAFRLANNSNDQVALIAQEHGVNILVGNDSQTFQNFVLTGEYGIPSNNTWIQIMNDVYFLASDGIRSFSAAVNNYSLLNAALTHNIQDYFARATRSDMRFAHATHNRAKQEVQFWLPLDGATTCANAVVFNYINQDKTSYVTDPMVLTRDGTTVACSTYFGEKWYGGGYDGILQEHYNGNTYNGTPIRWKISPAMFGPGDKEAIASLERLQIVTQGPRQKFLLNAFYYAKGGNGQMRRRQSRPRNKLIDSGAEDTTILGEWTLGVDPFPSDYTRQHDYYPFGMGHLWEVELSGNQSDHIIDLVQINYRLGIGGRDS